MRRSGLAVLGAAAAAGLLVGLLYGASGGLQTGILLATAGLIGIGAAHLAAARRGKLRLRRQFAIAVTVSVGVVLLATIAGALLMFVSDHDAVIVAVITVFAGLLAVRAAALLAAEVGGDIARVQTALAAVAEGRRDLRLQLSGRDEIAQLAAATDSMIDRIVEQEGRAARADQARRDLVAAASHDLRTPISALRLIVDALDDDLVDEPTRRRYQQTLHTHVRALGALVDDLFELTRIEAGDINWSLQQVSVGDLVEEAVTALERTARAKGVRLAAEIAEPRLRAHADPERLQRVLFNLVHNAIRHTPADGSVTVRARTPLNAGVVEIEVADTGTGIALTHTEAVFEPFFRGDDARTGDGAGLGLAISRAIVEALGGTIWIEPARIGTRVRFTVPVTA